MKTRLIRSLAVALAFTMFGYMSLSLKSASAQTSAAKTAPAKSVPSVNSPSAQPAAGAGVSMAPTGSGATAMENVETPIPVEVVEKAQGGCCSK